MLDPIALQLGKFLNFIYNNMTFHSYGLAIILFTLFIRIVLLPLTLKQYNSMARMQEVQPLIADIQKRYKNDKEKLNVELMKVYKDNNVNPAGGCLPLLIQMPILFSLYWVISQPLKFMLGIPVAKINELVGKLQVGQTNPEIAVINKFDSASAQFDPSVIETAKQILDQVSIERLIDLGKSFKFLKFNGFPGFNLGLIPKWQLDVILNDINYLVLILIPILAAFTTYLSIKYSYNQNQAAQKAGNDMQNSMQKSMTTIMPLTTAIFSFSVPAGLGVYWIIGNIIQILQQMYVNKYVLKKKKEVKTT